MTKSETVFLLFLKYKSDLKIDGVDINNDG